MKKFFSIFLFFVVGVSLSAVDFQTRYEHLLKNGRLSELKSHLADWEKAEPENPELFFAYFNFYKRQGKSSKVSVDSYKKESTSGLVLFDKKKDSVVAYVNDDEQYDDTSVEKALDNIEKAVGLASNRLDMYFARIDFLGQTGRYELQADSMIELIKMAKGAEQKWLWRGNKKLSVANSKRLISTKFRDYYKVWLREKEKKSKALELAKLCSKAHIEAYPEEILGYNILGTALVISRKYDEALVYCLKAEEINGKDDTAIFNIATCYERLNNKTNAIEYYQKLVNSGDKKLKAYAKKKLKQLK